MFWVEDLAPFLLIIPPTALLETINKQTCEVLNANREASIVMWRKDKKGHVIRRQEVPRCVTTEQHEDQAIHAAEVKKAASK